MPRKVIEFPPPKPQIPQAPTPVQLPTMRITLGGESYLIRTSVIIERETPADATPEERRSLDHV